MAKRKKKAIHEVISEVLRAKKKPLTVEEIYTEIQKRKLYDFRAKNPLHVVNSQLRRHCKDLDFPSARLDKYFSLLDGDRYSLLKKPLRVEQTAYKIKRGNHKQQVIVTAPADEPFGDAASSDATHTEIQWKLLDLGSRMGMTVWAPMNDRGRSWKGGRINSIPNLAQSLPLQFDLGTMKTIRNIDVIWLESRPNQPIVAAFEVEHTSAVYSGLLRMSDFMSMQPNLQLKWYLVAPDRRFDKFANEIIRPTFWNLQPPLHTVCRFLPYSRLLQRLDEANQFIEHLKPAFLDDVAELYDPAEAFAD